MLEITNEEWQKVLDIDARKTNELADLDAALQLVKDENEMLCHYEETHESMRKEIEKLKSTNKKLVKENSTLKINISAVLEKLDETLKLMEKFGLKKSIERVTSLDLLA